MTKRIRPRTSTTKPPKRREGRSYNSNSLSERPRKDLAKFYGVQACLAIFKHRRHEISRVFITPQVEERFDEVLEWCEKQRIPFKVGDYAELSRVAATEHHEGVCFEARPLATSTLESVLTKTKHLGGRCFLILEDVENPHNVGAILRTGCFFGVTAVVLISQQRGALSGAACRVAEGAAEVVPVVVADDADEVLKQMRHSGIQVVATTPHQAESVYSITWPRHVAILFGSEGSGLSPKALSQSDLRVVVPRIGTLESLNVGAAVASVLTEMRREAVVSGALKTRASV